MCLSADLQLAPYQLKWSNSRNGCRKVKILQKPVDQPLFIGVSTPGVEPKKNGLICDDSSSYGMWSHGPVAAAGQWILSGAIKLPASSVIRNDLLERRAPFDRAFCAGDEVVVVLDCTSHTLRLQSPTVRYVVDIQQQHHLHHWVLDINFGWGDHQVKLL